LVFHGRILCDGLLQALLERFEGEHLIRPTFSNSPLLIPFTGLNLVRSDGIQAVYAYDHRQLSVPEALRKLEEQYDIVDFELIRPSVEETIRRIYEEKLL